MYVRIAIKRAFSCSSSQWFFCCSSYKGDRNVYFNYNFPFPQVFGLRRLQSNPPRSLWLQHIHRMCCLTRRAHIAVPPLHKFEGTHGDRVAGDNTNAIDFVAIASSLRATNGRRAVGNTNRLKAVPPSFVCKLRTQTAQSDGTKHRASTLAFLAALRLVFRIRTNTYR